MQGGTLVVCPSYNKSSTIRAIARFPDAVTSALLVAFLAILEPITVFVWQKLHPRDDGIMGRAPGQAPKEYPRHCLFTLHGKPIEADAVRSVFERKTMKSVIVSVCLCVCVGV